VNHDELAALFELRLEVISGSLLSYMDTFDDLEIWPEAASELEAALEHIDIAIEYLATHKVGVINEQ
jgi:hypothetical protein